MQNRRAKQKSVFWIYRIWSLKGGYKGYLGGYTDNGKENGDYYLGLTV